jgi:PAS domain S-box-containing protein
MKKAKNNPDPDRLQVLILEDNPSDAELIERELHRAGIHFTSLSVKGKREYSKALAEFRPQVILSDFKMPIFNGLAALEVARRLAPATPFIFVSGSIGEEKAIELLAQGAADYILKDNLQRLGPAVKRVVEETRLKLEKKNNEQELRLLAEAADRFVHTNELDEVYDYLAQTICAISGADYLLLSLYDEKLQAVRPKIITGFEPFRETIRRRFHFDPTEMVFYLKDMRPDDFSDFVSRRLLPVHEGLYGLANRKVPRSICRLIEKILSINSMHTMGFSWENQLFGGLTVFFKKDNGLKNASQVEALANLAAVSIKRLLAEQALRESEKKYRSLVSQSPDGIFIVDLQGNFLSVNQAMCDGLKYSEAEFLSLKIWDIIPEQYMELHKKRLASILKGEAINEAAEYLVKGKDGEPHYIAILSAPFYKENTLIGFQGIARDISESKKMEIRLRESEEYYRTLVETSPDAIIIVDGGGRVTFTSAKAYEIFAIPAQIPIIGTSLMDYVEPGEIPRVQGRLVEILSGRSLPEIREYRLLRHDRRPFWGEISSSPLRDASGRNIGLLFICRDVSERKQAETQRQAALEALRESEDRYRDLVENSRDLICTHDLEGKMLSVNAAATGLTGYSHDDLLNMNMTDLLAPGVRHLFKAYLAEIQVSGRAHGTMRIQTAGGEIRHWEYDNTLRTKGVAVPFVRAVAHDITERELAEAELERKKAFLEKLVEAAPEGIAITDCPGRVLQVNSEFVKMFGYEVDEVVGKMIDDLLAPPGYQDEAGMLTKSSGEGKKVVLETVRKRKDGTLFNVSIIGAPIYIAEQQVAVYAIYRDISEQKQAESQREAALEELRISAEKWQSTFNSITDIVSVISLDHTFLEINKAGCDAMGLEREAIIGKKCYELVHHLHNPLAGCPCSLTLQSKKMETNEVFENGRYYQLIAWPIFDTDGELLAFSHSVKDISESRLAEEQIQHQAGLLQNVSDAIIATDKNQDIQVWNKAAEKIYGWNAEEAIGKNFHDLINPLYHYQSREEVIEKLAQEGAWSGEIIHHLRNGKQIPVHSTITILKDAAGVQAGSVSVNHDISERKHAEEQTRASLKEKEVLLQEIHHRVKNNLQIISGLLTLQADQSAGKSIDEIFRESQDRIRSIALIHEKLYRSHNLAEIIFDEYLRALIENLFLSHGVTAGRITVQYEMESMLFTIEKAIPLGLIVNELVTNALKHAFPAGQQGEIRIGLHGYEGAKSHALKTDSGTLHYFPTCELIVADTGVGLPAGQIPEQQKSLGMNLVSMLAKQLQAELKVHTGPGTEFRLIFPGLPANESAKSNNQSE